MEKCQNKKLYPECSKKTKGKKSKWKDVKTKSPKGMLSKRKVVRIEKSTLNVEKCQKGKMSGKKELFFNKNFLLKTFFLNSFAFHYLSFASHIKDFCSLHLSAGQVNFSSKFLV